MYNYTEKDQKVLKGKEVYYYSEYLEKAQEAGYDSLFEYVGALYGRYCSCTKIAGIVGVGRDTINRWIKLIGCEIMPRGGNSTGRGVKYAEGDEVFGKRIRYYPKHLEKATEAGYGSFVQYFKALLKKHKTARATAAIIGLSESSISRWIRLMKGEMV